MPERKTIESAREDKREGKAPTTQAGEFVREEMEHIREGKHGARSTKQAIAIGLSKARRAGVDLPPPAPGTVSEKTRRSAERAYEKGQHGETAVSSTRSRAIVGALKREDTAAASKPALAAQARSAARRRKQYRPRGLPSAPPPRTRRLVPARANVVANTRGRPPARRR